MTYEEKIKAARKYEQRVRSFIEEYLKQYPTIELIGEREDAGEHIVIEYSTLELMIKQESELAPNENYWYHFDRYKGYYCVDIMACTQDGWGEGRYVDTRDSEGIAMECISRYVEINMVVEYENLPEFCLPTPEEKAEEEARLKALEAEKERKRIEKERIRAEHVFRPDAEYVALIIPDVHGRMFWKEAVLKYPNMPVIFLGDYLDPYHNHIEDISADEALRNFEEILAYKRANSKRVVLLLGNHDLHYLWGDMDCSRKDKKNEMLIRNMFEQNWDLFDLVNGLECNGKFVICSHAGILPGWMKMRLPDINLLDSNVLCHKLNDLLRNEDTRSEYIHHLLIDASWDRGGISDYGSPVWADCSEHLSPKQQHKGGEISLALANDVYQLFGHSQQIEDPVYGEKFCCLDCRRAFLLTKDGLIAELKNDNV